jgi:hypothetical protein
MLALKRLLKKVCKGTGMERLLSDSSARNRQSKIQSKVESKRATHHVSPSGNHTAFSQMLRLKTMGSG